jgi:twitching motility protein PilT
MAEITLAELLKRLIDLDGSDLHLTANSPPMVRIHGLLEPLGDRQLNGDEVKLLVEGVLTDRQKSELENKQQVDFSSGIKALSRFRANVFYQRGDMGAVFRSIPYRIRSFEDLGLPGVIERLCDKPRGLVLVTGPTGSGKSTTLAAMIDKINRERRHHIITVEDPIEYIHDHKGCIVNQREVHSDAPSFAEALRAALRQDPDVVLIGEMRDLETTETALRIAETGHLTFATLHTNSAASTINRIIDIFPAQQQPQIRTQLGMVLEGIITQALVPNSAGDGRSLAMEILIPTPAIRNLIREDKIHQIYSTMQTSKEIGMQTLNKSLAALYLAGSISRDIALSLSSSPDELEDLIKRGTDGEGTGPVLPSVRRDTARGTRQDRV